MARGRSPAVIDGIGHSAELHALVPVLAVTAARLAALSWPSAGLLTAGRMLCDPGHDSSVSDAIGIAACVRTRSRSWIAWAGDCHGYGWDPDAQALTRYTVDATAAAYPAAHGVDPEPRDTTAGGCARCSPRSCRAPSTERSSPPGTRSF
ncbi:hypothetical protein [Streptomyces sp. NPDC055005]